MKLYKQELKMIKDICREIDLNVSITIHGDIRIDIMDGDTGKFNTQIMSSKMAIININEDRISFEPDDLFRDEMDMCEEITQDFIDNLLWTRRVNFNDVTICGDVTGNTREEFFGELFVEYLSRTNCKCGTLSYINKDKYYRCLFFKDGVICKEYVSLDDIHTHSIIFETSLNKIEELSGGVWFIGISPNYETPSRTALYGQLSRNCKNSNFTFKVVSH